MFMCTALAVFPEKGENTTWFHPNDYMMKIKKQFIIILQYVLVNCIVVATVGFKICFEMHEQ